MYDQLFFTIIIVCLNPGDKLKKTLESVLMQTFTNYEIIIKDGMSKDGALDAIMNQSRHCILCEAQFLDPQSHPFILNQSRHCILCEAQFLDPQSPLSILNQNRHCGLDPQSHPFIRLIQKPDTGIYDAMNQAIAEASGQYIYFLNCGDHLWNDQVLANIHEKITDNIDEAMIFYGNIYEELTGQEVYANPRIDRFACYRYLPCHQACFYHKNLLKERSFDIEYKVRADYEYFIWAVLSKGVKTSFIPIIIARYEGAGYSEAKKNQKFSKSEHQKITGKYMTKAEILKYRLILLITLAPLRTALSRNNQLAAFYNQIKKTIYKRKST